MSKKKILLIDDEEGICRMLKLNIDSADGYECLTCNSGEAGIELVKTHKPDLVLLDITMPGMGGVEALKQIKKVSPETPVAMVTAVHNPVEAGKCFEAGAYEYITKPVDMDYLQRALFVKLFD